MQVCRCGSTKIENKDKSTCASCNKADREAAREESKTQANKTSSLKRSGFKTKAEAVPLKRTALNPISKKQRAALNEKSKAYEEVSKRASGDFCETCGQTGVRLSRSHALSVGNFKLHESNPDNIVIECYGSSFSCHDLWEHRKKAYRKLYPEAFQRKMEVIQRLEPEYYRILLSKLDD